MNITGKTTIYVKEFTTQDGRPFTQYSALISKKNGDSYEYGYIQANFPREVRMLDKTKIDIKKGWLSFYKTKDNKYVPTVYIQEYELLTTKGSSGFIEPENDSSLPF